MGFQYIPVPTFLSVEVESEFQTCLISFMKLFVVPEAVMYRVYRSVNGTAGAPLGLIAEVNTTYYFGPYSLLVLKNRNQ
jgi:hypothetical protein